jgi:hypothetical protein
MITMTFAYLHQYENPFGLSPPEVRELPLHSLFNSKVSNTHPRMGRFVIF